MGQVIFKDNDRVIDIYLQHVGTIDGHTVEARNFLQPVVMLVDGTCTRISYTSDGRRTESEIFPRLVHLGTTLDLNNKRWILK